MSFSDTTENTLLNYLLDTLHSVSCYVALYVGSPGDDGASGTEVSGGAYARINHTSWNASSGGTKTNNGAVTFLTSTDVWGGGSAIDHFALYDAVTGGNLIAWGTITPIVIGSGQTPYIADGDVSVVLD